jgi:uncharacterized protein YdhG (YjbR/CyaY superfamily)
MPATFATVDEYLASFPDEVRAILDEVRRTIHRAVPDAGERMAYGMPHITVDGSSLVGFAAWRTHLGLYPAPTGDEDFERRAAPYRAARSTARFPIAGPIPYDLIAEMAALLAAQRADPHNAR